MPARCQAAGCRATCAHPCMWMAAPAGRPPSASTTTTSAGQPTAGSTALPARSADTCKHIRQCPRCWWVQMLVGGGPTGQATVHCTCFPAGWLLPLNPNPVAWLRASATIPPHLPPPSAQRCRRARASPRRSLANRPPPTSCWAAALSDCAMVAACTILAAAPGAACSCGVSSGSSCRVSCAANSPLPILADAHAAPVSGLRAGMAACRRGEWGTGSARWC